MSKLKTKRKPKELNIVFDPFPKQFQAWEYLTDDIHTEVGYGGGAHGGKTYLGCSWCTIQSLGYPGVRYAIGRRELKNLKRTTLNTFFEMCQNFGLINGYHYKVNWQDMVVRFYNGSEILLLDLAYQPSDPLFTRLGSLNLTGAFIEESNEVKRKAVTILSTRVGRQLNEKYGLLPKVFESFNPDKGHVNQRYWKPFKAGTLPPHRVFIRSLASDNPFTTEHYLDQLKRADVQTRERLLFGNFDYDDDPTRLFENEVIEDFLAAIVDKAEEDHSSQEGEKGENEKGEDKPSPPLAWYISVDVARFGRDKTVIILWHGLQIKKIIVLEKKSTDEVAKEIIKLCTDWKVRRSHVVIDEDGIGGGVVDQVTGCKGFLNNGSPIHPRKSIGNKLLKANFANLKTQCYFKMSDMMTEGAVGCDEIDENIKDDIIEELEVIKRKNADKDGKLQISPKDEIKEHIGRSPDFADAIMMRFFFELTPPRKFIFHQLPG